MKIISTAMNGGPIPDKYGKRGTDFNQFGVPVRSIPFSVEDAPAETVSYALLLEDKDAVSVCGFSWVHWTAAGIKKQVMEENASQEAGDFVQGINSWFGSCGREGALGYGGMTPPDRPHRYELHVFALDIVPKLQNGFYVDDLFRAMEGHVLEQMTVTGTYDN